MNAVDLDEEFLDVTVFMTFEWIDPNLAWEVKEKELKSKPSQNSAESEDSLQEFDPEGKRKLEMISVVQKISQPVLKDGCHTGLANRACVSCTLVKVTPLRQQINVSRMGEKFPYLQAKVQTEFMVTQELIVDLEQTDMSFLIKVF